MLQIRDRDEGRGPAAEPLEAVDNVCGRQRCPSLRPIEMLVAGD
jgi:hypothetical protein